MKSGAWDALDRAFAEFPILRAEPVPNEEIDAAGQALGVQFDPDYREFVRRYGGAIVGPYPIYGLRQAEPMDDSLWSVMVVTMHYRTEGWPGTDEWYIVSTDHAGNPIGMDREGVVRTYDHDARGVFKLADNFENYLLECLRD